MNRKHVNNAEVFQARSALVLAILAAVMSGCGTNKFQQELETEEAAIKLVSETIQGSYQLISTGELKKLMDSGKEFVLVDAMPADPSFRKGHIQGAINFEFPKEVLAAWDNNAIVGGTEEEFKQMLGDDNDRMIVVYCGFVKCARSHNAAVLARKSGYVKVYRYPGGIHAWRGAGYPLTAE